MTDDKTDDEKFYDDAIAPLLKRVAQMCISRNMPCCFAVQFKIGDIGEIRFKGDPPSIPMSIIGSAVRNTPNIDKLFLDIAKIVPDSYRDQSLVLKLMDDHIYSSKK